LLVVAVVELNTLQQVAVQMVEVMVAKDKVEALVIQQVQLTLVVAVVVTMIIIQLLEKLEVVVL
jgi:hypothetical protein